MTIVLVAPAIWAQPPEALPEFDVVSIKLYPHDDNGMIVRASASGIHLETTLRQLTRLAYQIQDFQLSTNGPAWLDSDFYDIDAKISTDGKPEQTDQLLRTLMAKRFKLKLRRESKEVPAYSLNIAKGRFKLRPAAEGRCAPIEPKASQARRRRAVTFLPLMGHMTPPVPGSLIWLPRCPAPWIVRSLTRRGLRGCSISI